MDTPMIAAYYRESDPMKRRALLDQAAAEGRIPGRTRYAEKSGKPVTMNRERTEARRTVS